MKLPIRMPPRRVASSGFKGNMPSVCEAMRSEATRGDIEIRASDATVGFAITASAKVGLNE